MTRRSLEQCVEEKRCALCELPDQDDEIFCYGCRSYVCNACSVNDNIAFGGHDVIEHEQTEDEDLD